MSKIAIKGNESGTATFTIEAPATNTDRIFELPDEAGKVLTDASDIEPQVKTATNASGAAPIYACRAWVNADGSTTPPSIRGSENVSSVTRVATGKFTINFTTAMPDENYSAQVSGGRVNQFPTLAFTEPTRVYTASAVGVSFSDQSGSRENIIYILVAIFR